MMIKKMLFLSLFFISSSVIAIENEQNVQDALNKFNAELENFNEMIENENPCEAEGLTKEECDIKIRYDVSLGFLIAGYARGQDNTVKERLLLKTKEHIPLSLYTEYVSECKKIHINDSEVYDCADEKVMKRFSGLD